jgi:lipopolysaccharide/colanic/teichoic acid biosynthesis glycosyltransferase
MTPLRKFMHAWRFATAPHDPSTPLHSADRMQGLLARERMRSDRGNSNFALLSFNFPRPCGAAELATLAQVFAARLRATDDAGILAADRVGIILPETPADGAWKLAEDLIELFPTQMRQVSPEVYTYPSDDDSFDRTDGEETVLRPTANGVAMHTQADNGVAVHFQSREPQPMHTLFAQPLPRWKRLFDIVVSSIAIVVLSPLLLLVGVAIKITSPGPIIFRQRRDTLGGRPFMIYKFRTMSVDAEQRRAALREFSEQDGPAFKIAKDPRVTRVGRLLRSTSIDELPQLFNVLLGDMTLVGPRALPSFESSGCEPWQRRRLDVTAGITCIWQVYGRSSVSFAEWMRMDLRYIRTRSARGDLKLLVQTVPAVVTGRGAC